MKAAEGGYPFAMYLVGAAYQTGEGVAADPAEAKRWFEKAAESGDPDGMYSLGFVYHAGTVGARDPALAADWIVKAIQTGSYQVVRKLMTNPGGWRLDFRKQLQQRLRDAGLYHDKIDGRMNAATRQAIVELAKAAK